jgi:hypothetical protein
MRPNRSVLDSWISPGLRKRQKIGSIQANFTEKIRM